MTRRFRPSLHDGPLTAENEDAIWTAAFSVPFLRAPPLTGWLLSAAGHWGDERWISSALANALSISHKMLEAGGPKRRSTYLRAVTSMGRFIERKVAELTSDSAARRVRSLQRTADVLRQDISATPCTMFHQTIGAAGGDLLESLAINLDNVSAHILGSPDTRNRAPEMIVRAAEDAGVIKAGAMGARPDLDPGLDALLLLLARLDRDRAVELIESDTSISSFFALLVDIPGSEKRQRPSHRLLDMYYALAFAASTGRLPDYRPSIAQIEVMLLAEVPESGARSAVVRWRSGHTLLRFEQVEEMVELLVKRHGQDFDKHFRVLWTVAQIWDLIGLSGPEATRLAGERYRQWWNAMESEGRVAAPLTHSYWTQFQPHA